MIKRNYTVYKNLTNVQLMMYINVFLAQKSTKLKLCKKLNTYVQWKLEQFGKKGVIFKFNSDYFK